MIAVPFTFTVSARLAAATMAVTIVMMGTFALIIDRYVDRVARDNADSAAHRAVLLLESPHVATDAEAMRLAASPLGFEATLLTPQGRPSIATTPTPPSILRALATAIPCVPISVGPHGQRYRFIVGAPARKRRLLIWRRIDGADEIDRRIASIALALLVVLAIPTLFACVVLVRVALRPIGRITLAAAEIDERSFSFPVQYRGDDEVARLAAALSAMTQRLDRSFERLREYAVEAAHELRAPLSAIVTEADLALAQARDPHAYRAALVRIESAANDLHAITRDVLLGASAQATEPVDLAAVVLDASRDLEVAARKRGVRLRTATRPAWLLANRTSVRRLATALIDNATRFARGEVLVEVREDDGDVALRVTDDGPGIAPNIATRIFSRRWREERRTGVNVGLGLTLSKEIVERYGGTIGFETDRGVGACAIVHLPAAPRIPVVSARPDGLDAEVVR